MQTGKMSSKDKDIVISMRHLLQKNMKSVVLAIPLLELTETQSKQEVAMVTNLLEQKHSVDTMQSSKESILMSQFPDLRSRLMVRLSQEIEGKREILTSHIAPYKELQQLAHRARTDGIRLCRQYPQELDGQTMSDGEATVPPLATMLLWLDRLEKDLRQIYNLKLFYLEDLFTVVPATLPRDWLSHVSELMKQLKDYEEQTGFFLLEDG